jgi:hypothetical protein
MSVEISKKKPRLNNRRQRSAQAEADAGAASAATGSWEDARRRLQEAREADPALAAALERPLRKDAPQDDRLTALRAGEFRRRP